MPKPIMTVNVEITGSQSLGGEDYSVSLLHFHAEAEGELFNGSTTRDGIDTQTFIGGKFNMSARYMLEGKDFEGNDCKVFIENSGSTLSDLTPKIVTDSEALRFLQEQELYAQGESIGDGVIIKIYKQGE